MFFFWVFCLILLNKLSNRLNLIEERETEIEVEQVDNEHQQPAAQIDNENVHSQ